MRTVFALFILTLALPLAAEPRVLVDRNQKTDETPDFRFKLAPALSDTDAGQDATLEVIEGRADWGCDPRQLIDGIGPSDREDFGRTFHFGQGTASGRLRMDFGSPRTVSQVNTYSWNPGARAPQVYTLYASDGAAANFSTAPGPNTDPTTVGWRLIATVDTRPDGFLKRDGGGGQYAVSIADADPAQPLGRFRYLLWDVQPTNEQRTESTCYAEFDVVVADAPSPTRLATARTRGGQTFTGPARFDADVLYITDKSGEQRLKLTDLASATFRDPPPAADAADAAPSAGGLKGEYFDDQDLKRPKLVRYDPTVNFAWGLAAPDPSVAPDFSARWTGQVEPKFTETYVFYTRADDGCRLWVDGKLLIDKWDDQPPYEQRGTIALQAGRKYDLRLEYHDKMAEAKAQLLWSCPSQPTQQVVPASQLSPPPNDAAAPPRVTLTSPRPQRWVIAPASIDLDAVAVPPPGGRIARVEFFAGGTLLGTATEAPYHTTWAHPLPGYHKVTARATDGNGTVASSAAVAVGVADNGNGTLPPPWGTVRIGASQKPDVAKHSGGLFTIRAGGGELRGAFDSGFLVGQPLEGDGQITARVGEIVSEDSPNAVTGLMIRESLAGEARYAALMAGKEGVEFLRRWEPASWVAAIDVARTVPCYLRLVRSGKNFKAYVSDNGNAWQMVGSEQVPLGAQAYVGVITTSRSEEGMCHVSLDHVLVQAGGVPMEATTSGVKTRGGSFVAGDIYQIDERHIVVAPKRGPRISFDPAEVARVVFKPLPTELAAAIGTGRTGVLLSAGDFFEGDLRSYHDGRSTVDSVVFGARTFESHEVLAAVLHDPKPDDAAAHAHVRTTDGSVYTPRAIRLENARLCFTDDAVGDVSISLRDVAEIGG